jgi:hypothetical protein
MERKLVFAPLAHDAGTAIRIAGIADLESNNTTIDPGRVDILRRASAELLGIDAAGDVKPWCGLRPTTPDSRPIIGWSPLDGLFINSGPRHARLDARLRQRATGGRYDRSQAGRQRGERVCAAARGMKGRSPPYCWGNQVQPDQIPHLGMPRQANCRTCCFRPITAPATHAALFFSRDFREDRGQGSKEGASQ